MKSLISSKGQKKRGISLSISKNCSSLSKNESSHPKSMQYSCHLSQTPVNIQPKHTISVNRPAVIIYRYKKSQWDQLQQKNRKKREQVKHLKCQLQNLNSQLQQWKNKQPKKQYLSQRSQLDKFSKKDVNIQRKPLNPSNNRVRVPELNSSFNYNYSFLKQKQERNMKSYCQFKTESQKQIQIINTIQSTQQNKEIMNTQSEENYRSIKKQSKGQRRGQNRTKNLQIDLNSLEQIQKRLSKLIDFTTCT